MMQTWIQECLADQPQLTDDEMNEVLQVALAAIRLHIQRRPENALRLRQIERELEHRLRWRGAISGQGPPDG